MGDDPTVAALEERLADLLGKEAAVFVPSGTMSNQLGVRVHCQPGDELICETGCHIYNYEQGGASQLSGVATRTVDGDCGVLQQAQLENLIRPDDDHCVRTRLVCLENTHNRGGGKIQPYEVVESVCAWARANDLATHLDGARLWNAAVATGIAERQWAQHFDTVSVCFSKGLGAPVGSALCGSRPHIQRARRFRKLFGGGMRQAGIVAAAALHALEHHRDRLAEDHARARRLAAGLRSLHGLELLSSEVDTNIVVFRVADWVGSPAQLQERLRARGVLINPIGRGMMRAVTHLDVDDRAVDRAIEALAAAVGEAAQEGSQKAARRSAYA